MTAPKAPALVLGENVAATMEGTLLHIVVDTGRALRRSKQRMTATGPKGGENVIIATTGGNQALPGTEIKVGLNIYRPPKAGE